MKNIHCDIIEQERDLSKYDGRPLILPQATTKILNDLQLLPAVQKFGHQINILRHRTHTGNPLFDHGLNYPFPFIGISEKIFIQILLDKFKQLPNGKVVMNDSVKFTENKAGKWDCSYRKSLIKQEYDLLIGAEGVDSKIRKEFFKATAMPSKLERVSTIMKLPSYMDYQDQSIEWWGGVGKFHVYPISNDTVGVESIWYFPYHSGRKSNSNALVLQFDRMHKNWSGLGIETLLAELSHTKHAKDSLLTFDFEAFYDNILDEFVTKNIALVGDSAHSIDPSGHSRTTVAFEDAIVLAKCLSNDNQTIEESLKEYQKLRKDEPKVLNELSKSLSNEYTKETGRFKKFIRILRILMYKGFYLKYRLGKILKRTSV